MESENSRKEPFRVAIVGGGISGIACSWKLRETNFLVDIYDADDRLGGHANSVPFSGNGRSVNVDTGFIAMNETSYPQFTAFLRALGVPTIPTDMSFGVSVNGGIFEWGSSSIESFVGTASNLLSLWFWRLIFDLIRFNLFAEDILGETAAKKCYIDGGESGMSPEDLLSKDLRNNQFESIGMWLQRNGYSTDFLRLVVIPMVAAPWCTDPDEFSRLFPAKPLIHFMSQHSLLSTMWTTLTWRSFQNGSRIYVDAFQRSLPPTHQVYLNTRIQKISRASDRLLIQLEDNTTRTYDHVVLCVHANQALGILGDDATSLERAVLSCFKTSRNTCYLHSDTSFLPKRHSARMAWNCLLETPEYPLIYSRVVAENKHTEQFERLSRISITFDMNKLQAIPTPDRLESPGRVLVTMNPTHMPLLTQSMQIYYHPIINSDALIASRYLHEINGVAGVSFAGAWMGWGFHEDGFAAGTHAARTVLRVNERGSSTERLDLFGDFNACRPRPRNVGEVAARWIINTVQRYLLRGS